MTSHATHSSTFTIGDELDFTEPIWEDVLLSESAPPPTPTVHTSTNGHSKEGRNDPHPLAGLSPVLSEPEGDGLTNGMPTRPTLQRVLEGSFGPYVGGETSGSRARSRSNTGTSTSNWSESGLSDAGSGSVTPSDDTSEVKQVVNGVEVIVHQVKPTDSLAGVALKYDVPLATLRRTNKLWPSDPIHLRSTLYIPIPQTHPRPSRTSRPSFTHSASVPALPKSPPLLPIDDPSTSTLTASSRRKGKSPETIRNAGERKVIPAEELSFFPPPKTSSALAASDVDTLPRRHTRATTAAASVLPSSINGSPSGSPRPHTLLDIFKALPDVSALGRRSLDSLSMGSSAREEGEEAVVELEMETRRGRRLNEPLRPSAGMVIRPGGARGTPEEEEEEDWL